MTKDLGLELLLFLHFPVFSGNFLTCTRQEHGSLCSKKGRETQKLHLFPGVDGEHWGLPCCLFTGIQEDLRPRVCGSWVAPTFV